MVTIDSAAFSEVTSLILTLFFGRRILFQFNQNEHKHLHARVKPPRMDGKSSGVFATRSPHRPNGIGLSLVKMDRVEGEFICCS